MEVKESWNATEECRKNLRLYVIVLCASIICSLFFSMSIPNNFISRTTISIDSNDKNPLAKGNFMVNLKNMLSASESNVLTEPYVYLKILDSPYFRQKILQTKILTQNNKTKKTYARHLQQDNRRPWWESLLSEKNVKEMADENIKYEMKLKNGLIIIEVSDQDPFVANALVDSIVNHLHTFLSDYMTKKAMVNYANKKNEMEKTASEYHKAMAAYTSFANTNTYATIPNTRIKLEALNAEMNRTLSAYNEATLAFKMAQMEVQRQRPTFFKIVTNTKALHPSNPKWIQNITLWAFYSILITTFYILYRKRWEEQNKRTKE